MQTDEHQPDHPSIDELEKSDSLSRDSFLLAEASVRETKAGDPYVAGALRDETGKIPLRQWDTDEHPDTGQVVRVKGNVDSYQGDLQIVAHALSPAPEADPTDFTPSAHRPACELLGEVVAMLERHCKPEMVDAVLDAADCLEDGAYRKSEQVQRMPAAQSNHHARSGGLVEHIHSMAHLAVDLADHYRDRYDADLDLGALLAGVVLHDIGKVDELSSPWRTEYTEKGQKLGHIPIGLVRWNHAVGRHDLFGERARQVAHLILSHHGRKEWGSPVEPQTPEAQLLHQIDMLDSRMDPALTEAEGGGA